MTTERAIKQLEYLKLGQVCGGSATREACNMAIKALERQIPKKPSEVKEYEDESYYRLDFLCPNCNTAVIGQPYRPKHCKHCGQELDWRENND